MTRSALAGSLAALVVAGCSSTSPQPKPPGTSMVPFSGDHFSDTGIRPDPDAPDPTSSSSGRIIVEWHQVDNAKLEGARLGGYYLYRSDTSDVNGAPLNFRRIATITGGTPGGDTIYADGDVRQGIRYSYQVSAYSKSDASLESDRSDTVSFTLLDRPVPSMPIGDITLGATPLRFGFSSPGMVALRLDEVLPENETVTVDSVWRYVGQVDDFSDPHVQYGGPALAAGKRYRWRVDRIIQGTPQANASRWVTFSVK